MKLFTNTLTNYKGKKYVLQFSTDQAGQMLLKPNQYTQKL